MTDTRPDYFNSTTPVEAALRRIKGNYRKEFILRHIENAGIDSVPAPWLEHNLSTGLKDLLGSQSPGYRGGEDLPDLVEGEVEIARISLLDSVHCEVTSLRASRNDDGQIALRIVDEYGEWSDYVFELEQDTFPSFLSAKEVLQVFSNSNPCPCKSFCSMRFSSSFYPELDELADELKIKVHWEV